MTQYTVEFHCWRGHTKRTVEAADLDAAMDAAIEAAPRSVGDLLLGFRNEAGECIGIVVIENGVVRRAKG